MVVVGYLEALLMETVVLLKNAVFLDVTPCGSLRTDVSEERSASMIRMTRIGVLGTTLAITNNWRTLRRNTMFSYFQFLVCSPDHVCVCVSHSGDLVFLLCSAFIIRNLNFVGVTLYFTLLWILVLQLSPSALVLTFPVLVPSLFHLFY
jgi:hypothetical protein